jgi:glycosyltransferase involved in cell wall biosynthesis
MSTAVRILSDARWSGPHGIGRFAKNILSRLPEHMQLKSGPKPLSPVDPFWLSYQIATLRPSVFFSPGFNAPAISTRPLIITIHDLIHIQFPAFATWARRLYYQLLVKPAATRAVCVLTGSEYSRTQILKWSGLPEERVVNISYGVESLFRPEGPRYEPGYPYLLYVGNFRAHKNLGRLLAAFARVDRPELRLILTGDKTPELGERIEALKLEHRVKFAGTVSDEVLSRLYRGATLLIFPSLLEGFGLPALEAMACGTPVIASRTTALPEVVGDTGVLIDPLDIEDIRRAMERVVGDADLRRRMRIAGLLRARQFSWDCVAEKVHRAIFQALGSA